MPGYNTRLECELLRGKGLAYKPDIVVVGWCNNDYSLPLFLLQETDFRCLDISFVYCLTTVRLKSSENTVVFHHQALDFACSVEKEAVKWAFSRKG